MFDVVTIGTATRDVFVRTSSLRTLRDKAHLEKIGFLTGTAQCLPEGGKVEIEAPVVIPGGGATNAAITFARNGLRTASVLKIGRDEAGESVLADLKKEGIKTYPIFDKKELTAFSVVLVSSETGQRTILSHRGAANDLKDRDIPFQKIRAKWAYITPGHIAPATIFRIVQTLKRTGTRVAMNPSEYYVKLGHRKLAKLLKQLDVIIMNREEAAVFTGLPYEDERAIFKKFDEYIPGIAVMSEAERGALVSDGRHIFRSNIFRVDPVLDTTGAGDAFGSGFVSALAKTKTIDEKVIREAIRFATANAASVVMKLGASAGILRTADVGSRKWQGLKIEVSEI